MDWFMKYVYLLKWKYYRFTLDPNQLEEVRLILQDDYVDPSDAELARYQKRLRDKDRMIDLLIIIFSFQIGSSLLMLLASWVFGWFS